MGWGVNIYVTNYLENKLIGVFLVKNTLDLLFKQMLTVISGITTES